MSRSAVVKTALPGPRSQALMARKEKYVPDAFSIHVPVAIAHARGALVTDVDGNTFIDLAGGLGCMNVGHSHPQVVQAIQESAAAFSHTDFTVIMYESYIRLAERLCALAPGAFAKKACFFNSGAEAVENAIKFARKYTGRAGIIALSGAFHGRTNLTMSLTSKVKPYKADFGPFAPEVYRVPAPYVYRRPHGMSEAAYVQSCVEALENAFRLLVAPEDCAALILEPVQGEGGFVPLPKEYLTQVAAICRQHGVLLIADEIQCGYARTGTFFASEQLGLEPDLITTGKSIASGLPLSGVIGRQEIMDAPGDSTIGGTYVGNPIACAAANAVLDVVESERLTERAQAIGAQIRGWASSLAERCDLIGDIRGLGAMIGLELVLDRTTREPASVQTGDIVHRCIDKGVIVVKSGIYGNVIRFLSPLTITREELAEALAVLEESLLAVANGK